LKDASSDHANTSSSAGLSACPVTPVVTQTATPSVPVALIAHTHIVIVPSSLVPPPPPPPPPSQAPATIHHPGIRKQDLIQLEQEIISSPWYAANALEPTCGTPGCPYAADRYGICGMSCYTPFVDTKPNGTFGCWREECSAYSTQKREDAVKHQRANHFNHRPFLCTPTNGTVWSVALSTVSSLRSSYSNLRS
jgi:hypothetical protein